MDNGVFQSSQFKTRMNNKVKSPYLCIYLRQDFSKHKTPSSTNINYFLKSISISLQSKQSTLRVWLYIDEYDDVMDILW